MFFCQGNKPTNPVSNWHSDVLEEAWQDKRMRRENTHWEMLNPKANRVTHCTSNPWGGKQSLLRQRLCEHSLKPEHIKHTHVQIWSLFWSVSAFTRKAKFWTKAALISPLMVLFCQFEGLFCQILSSSGPILECNEHSFTVALPIPFSTRRPRWQLCLIVLLYFVCACTCNAYSITLFRSPRGQPPWRAACAELWAMGRNRADLLACQESLLQVACACERTVPVWDPQDAGKYMQLDCHCQNRSRYRAVFWHPVGFPEPSWATAEIKANKGKYQSLSKATAWKSILNFPHWRVKTVFFYSILFYF